MAAGFPTRRRRGQERLAELGEGIGNAALVRGIEILGQAIVDIRGTDVADPRLVLEVAVVRLGRRDAGPPLQMLLDRVERLERAVAGGAGAPASAGPATAGRRPRGPRRALPGPRPASGGRRAARSDPQPSTRVPAAGSETTDGPAASGPESRALRRVAVPAANPWPRPTPVPARCPAPTVGDEAGDPAGDAAPAGPLPDIELDDVIVAWAEILLELLMATRTAVQDAQPIGSKAR